MIICIWSLPLFQEDCSILERADLSPHSRVAIELRLVEKQILEKALASGQAKRTHFQKMLDEGAPLPHYEESDIALLENTDADTKLPIILSQIEEVQEIQVKEQCHILNGEKAVYNMDVQANEDPVQEERRVKVSKDVTSALDLIASSDATQKSQREVANLSAIRTEENSKENSE